MHFRGPPNMINISSTLGTYGVFRDKGRRSHHVISSNLTLQGKNLEQIALQGKNKLLNRARTLNKLQLMWIDETRK